MNNKLEARHEVEVLKAYWMLYPHFLSSKSSHRMSAPRQIHSYLEKGFNVIQYTGLHWYSVLTDMTQPIS